MENNEELCECGHYKEAHKVTVTDHPDFLDTSDACSECISIKDAGYDEDCCFSFQSKK